MFDVAKAAVEGALAGGATYADARVVSSRDQRIAARNGTIDDLTQGERVGLGVRALVGSSWGFYAIDDLGSTAARRAGQRAAEIALASATVAGPPLVLADVPAVEDRYETPHEEDPFEVSLSDKADLVIDLTSTMATRPQIAIAKAELRFWDTEKWFVSSQGSAIHQRLLESGGGMDALAIGDGESQIRSYPQARGQYNTGGYELVTELDMAAHAERVADQAAALLTAPQCPTGEMDLILEGSQLALQIHESVGHAIELDRILGWEAAFAGTSFLDLATISNFTYGSELMNITADATIPGALGTFGYDDEGTPAQRVDIVKEGRWVGVLSGRDSASLAGVAPGGMVRADGYHRMPMVRMTNVGLLPGDSSLDEIIAATDHGILMETNRSWSIDDKRLNFQFGCEIGWLIENGVATTMVKNPTYTGITPRFWASLDRLAGRNEWVHWGTPNCGKGQPLQIGHTGHSASPGRFRKVRVGVVA